MSSFAFITILVGIVAADWEVTKVRVDTWKTCETDDDCLENSSCVDYITMGNYADLTSQHGCVTDMKCAGTGSWSDGTQYFCNEEQQARGNAGH